MKKWEQGGRNLTGSMSSNINPTKRNPRKNTVKMRLKIDKFKNTIKNSSQLKGMSVYIIRPTNYSEQ